MRTSPSWNMTKNTILIGFLFFSISFFGGCASSTNENTAATMEAAYVRPRHYGYMDFQAKASNFLREAFEEGKTSRDIVIEIRSLYEESHR